ncbi:MAG: Asp-tRNA(Asn)/Glu-tRNA(Gln) amidotransferase GatCAB subunit B, partial [Candidatus Nanoarchaeia archaeon]
MSKIGLEIHGYLQTKEKLFCRCKAARHSAKQEIKPNSFVCPICTGQPGCKPMLPNAEAIKKIIQISLLLNCKINTFEKGKKLIWQRKHYDWPDLPKGYQNTLSGPYSVPVGENGEFEGIRIKEIHLEEDSAAWNPETGCIDYNRSGLPLVEIVTEPDFKNEEEVELWLKKLILTLNYIKAIDKNAGLKADVNVSTSGERVEIKNITSIESIKAAIKYEIERQSK